MKKEAKSVSYLNQKQQFTRTLAQLEVAQLKIADLKSLMQVTSALNANIDSYKLLETIASTAKNVIKAEGAALLLYDRTKHELCYEVVVTQKGTYADRNLRVAKGVGIEGAVAQNKKPMYVSDLKKNPKPVHFPIGYLYQGVQSVLAVPMLSRDKLVGVLEAVNPSLKRFVAEEAMDLFSFFASEAAVAISNARHFSEFRKLFVNTVRSLVQALEAKDPYTSGHAQRVAHFALILAQELQIPPQDWENVELAALLHDIGKIGVPEEILNKPSQVTEEEFEEIKKHPEQGMKILAPMEHMEKVLPGVFYHHERWDGKGYPKGLKGEEIPIAARIVSVADALDAMTSTRAYRKALPDEEALRRLKEASGTQFDPKVTQALFRAYDRRQIVTANQAHQAA